MKLFVLGVNHETAPIDVREKVCFSSKQTQDALAEFKQIGAENETIILSTCNRTEIYCNLKSLSSKEIHHWLHQFFNIQKDEIDSYLYEYTDLEAIKHIMRVASGLNSLVLGEPQIFGQIKNAYNCAVKANTIHQKLDYLFQQIFKTVKQIRTDTAIGSSPVSIAFSAVALAEQFFGKLNQQTALLIGAGETIELTARHLHEHGIGKIIVANRTLDNAHQITEQFSGYAIKLEEIDDHLREADMIISSTGSTQPIIKKPMVQAALKSRKNKPIFMVDIAVPRDIEPSVSELNNVYLYSVDDLTEIINENKQSRQNAAIAAEEIVEVQANNFMAQYQATVKASPLIQEFRQQAYQMKDKSIDEALSQLENGESPDEVVKKLANQLTNKLLHVPTTNIHKAGLEGQQHVIDSAHSILLNVDHS